MSPSDPWRSFFDDLNEALDEPLKLHCIGGFVVSQLYGIARSTADVDYLALMPPDFRVRLEELAGLASRLFKAHKIYLQAVNIATYPADYEQRLVPLFPGSWSRIE